MSEPNNDPIVELADSELSEVQGGILIGLLVPAVQAARESASSSHPDDATGVIVGAGPGAGPHVK